MDTDSLLAAVREENATALDRLGSDKALLAATNAQLETDAVLGVTASTLAAASDTAAAWADKTSGEAADALGRAAETYADARDRVTEEGTDASADPVFLRLDAAGDCERVAAATVAAPLVLDRLLLQCVSFFVNEADTARADRFRDVREQCDDLLDDGAAAAAAVCDSQEAAVGAATATIEAAYDDYAARLDAMGFDPKPIC